MYENLARLDLVGPALARALGDPGWERLEASLVSGGKSNLTFELTSDAGEAVLQVAGSGRPLTWPAASPCCGVCTR
jgi:hypothetical protein